MFDWVLDFQRERAIRRTLSGLARQRVSIVLQPGNIVIIENADHDTAERYAHLRTCHLRGWVEVVSESMQKGRLAPDGSLPDGPLYDHVGPIYRLTDAGWHQLRRTHAWVVAATLLAGLALIATALQLAR